MVTKQTAPLAPSALRQLRRTRSFYAAGVALWATGTAFGAADQSGGRQMWVPLVFLVVFAGLLSLTSLLLWRHHTAVRGATAHHARPGRPVTARQSDHRVGAHAG